MPTLSIVTISFNQAEFLERAILSVIGQQGVDIEYIVVDPGSTDGSREIIARYADRIQTLILEPDKGAADGLNKGLAAATGRYFSYLNSDDEYLPGALAEAVAVLDRNPDVDVVYGSGWRADEHGRCDKLLVPTRHFDAARFVAGRGNIVQQASFMRTDRLKAVGGFNVANTTCWDGEAFFDMARQGARFRRVDRQWALFRIYGGSISGSGRLAEQYRRDHARMFEALHGRPPGKIDQLAGRFGQIVDRLADPVMTVKKIGNAFR